MQIKKLNNINHTPDPEVNGWSIVLPTRKSSGNLELFLKSLEVNSHFKHELIIICDIFSSWKTYKLLQDKNLWYYQQNFCNFYASANYGVTKATRDYLVICQDDTVFSKNWDLNITRYLSHNAYITPHLIQCWEINNYFGMNKEKPMLSDFRIDLYNQYCQQTQVDRLDESICANHPIIISKETFNRHNGFTTFTVAEGQHIQHEHGLKMRIMSSGGRTVGCLNSTICHLPQAGWDYDCPDYGYRVNFGRELNNHRIPNLKNAHYPVKCNKCGLERDGYLLSQEEIRMAEECLIWNCEKCR